MKRYFLILALVVVMMTASMAYAGEEATVGTGTMKIGGILQSGLVFYLGNEMAHGSNSQATDRLVDYAFYVKRARLLMAGAVVDERVTWFTQFEFARDATALAAASGGFADILLDMKMGFHYIPYTGIYVGRFLPKFTYFGPSHTGKLMLINYPMLSGMMFGVQRQTGIDFGVKTTFLDANLGFFNGRAYAIGFGAPANANVPVGNQNWYDENNGKDLYFNLVGKPPVEGLKVFAGLWYGTPLDGWDMEDGEGTEQNATVMFINAGAAYSAPFGLTAIAELLYGTYSWDSSDAADADRADDTYEFTAMSYYIMAGFNFGPMFEVPVEVLLRYDYFDPDTENDEDTHGYKDALTDITFGINYYIKSYHAMLSLNYIYHGEEWEDVGNLAQDDVQDGISNDELRIQAQVAF